jgi:hypothetical protein
MSSGSFAMPTLDSFRPSWPSTLRLHEAIRNDPALRKTSSAEGPGRERDDRNRVSIALSSSYEFSHRSASQSDHAV